MLKTEMNKKPDPAETKNSDKNQAGDKNQPGPEQDLLDIFVAQGMKIVMKIAPTLKDKGSVDALGNALFNIVNKIETEGTSNGVNFPQWVLIRGARDILIYLIDTVQIKVTEDQVKAIVGIAVGKYLKNALDTGKMTKEQAVELAKQLSQKPIQEMAQGPRTEKPAIPPNNPQMPMQSGAGGMING
jgi:hypothetical protein